MHRPSLAAACLLLVGSALTGCAATVHLDPAPRANDPLCADVMVRLPDSVGGFDRRWTDAQSTAAWGDDETAIILSCGLEPPAPTTQQCVTIDGVDWIVDDEDYPYLRLTTYGRQPAVQVYVDSATIAPDAALAGNALGSRVQPLPSDARCVAPDEADPDRPDDLPTTGTDEG